MGRKGDLEIKFPRLYPKDLKMIKFRFLEM